MPAEESVLVSYFLRMSNNGYLLPVKFAGSLANRVPIIQDVLSSETLCQVKRFLRSITF
jgi:hypothetical protein